MSVNDRKNMSKPDVVVSEHPIDNIDSISYVDSENDSEITVLPSNHSLEETPLPVEVESNISYVDENLKLAKELNLTIRTNPETGKPIIPSTPAMRNALLRKQKTRIIDTSTTDIETMVSEQYGDQVLLDPNVKHTISTLSTYVKRMSPNASVDETRGGEMQASLARLYDTVLSLSPELSNVCLEIIVSVFKLNLSGAFNQTLAYRFANTIPLNKDLSIRFQMLTTLFISLASGTKKKDLAKTINVRQLQEYITDRAAKANISEFIN